MCFQLGELQTLQAENKIKRHITAMANDGYCLVKFLLLFRKRCPTHAVVAYHAPLRSTMRERCSAALKIIFCHLENKDTYIRLAFMDTAQLSIQSSSTNSHTSWTALGNRFYFQIVQSCSVEIAERWSNHTRGWEELRYCTAERTLKQHFVQVRERIWLLHLSKTKQKQQQQHSLVQLTWRQDFNFICALHLQKSTLTDIELKMIAAWFVFL